MASSVPTQRSATLLIQAGKSLYCPDNGCRRRTVTTFYSLNTNDVRIRRWIPHVKCGETYPSLLLLLNGSHELLARLHRVPAWLGYTTHKLSSRRQI